jgi:hypothetical protein
MMDPRDIDLRSVKMCEKMMWHSRVAYMIEVDQDMKRETECRPDGGAMAAGVRQ